MNREKIIADVQATCMSIFQELAVCGARGLRTEWTKIFHKSQTRIYHDNLPSVH
jgi:hypothetical protein